MDDEELCPRSRRRLWARLTDEGMVTCLGLSRATLGYPHDSLDSLDQLEMEGSFVKYSRAIGANLS